MRDIYSMHTFLTEKKLNVGEQEIDLTFGIQMDVYRPGGTLAKSGGSKGEWFGWSSGSDRALKQAASAELWFVSWQNFIHDTDLSLSFQSEVSSQAWWCVPIIPASWEGY